MSIGSHTGGKYRQSSQEVGSSPSTSTMFLGSIGSLIGTVLTCAGFVTLAVLGALHVPAGMGIDNQQFRPGLALLQGPFCAALQCDDPSVRDVTDARKTIKTAQAEAKGQAKDGAAGSGSSSTALTTPKPVSANIYFQKSKVTRSKREAIHGHSGLTIWMTGLSGAGKTSIAIETEKQLLGNGNGDADVQVHSLYRLDGDNLRFGLSSDLGFSELDRKENIRRTAEVAKLFNDAGFVVICSLISPYRADRELARKMHDVDGLPFVEVFVDSTLSEAEKRDPKGLYKKARAGKIKNFTGIDAPYEPPQSPEIRLDTSDPTVTVQESAAELIARIKKEVALPPKPVEKPAEVEAPSKSGKEAEL